MAYIVQPKFLQSSFAEVLWNQDASFGTYEFFGLLEAYKNKNRNLGEGWCAGGVPSSCSAAKFVLPKSVCPWLSMAIFYWDFFLCGIEMRGM